MEKDYIEIENAQPVFNFDFSTIMLFRCAETKYSKNFLDGEIHFSQPQTWIEQGKKRK